MSDYTTAMNDLLTAMAVTVGASEAAGFTLEWDSRGQPEIRVVTHIRPDDATDRQRLEAVAAFSAIVLPCARQRKDDAILVERTSEHADGPQYCLVRIFNFTEFTGSAAAFIARTKTESQARLLLERLGVWSSAKVWHVVGWR